jgi:DNA-binding XRE family transcriptional regulator
MNKEEICQFVFSTRTKKGLSQAGLANEIKKRRQAVFEIEKNMVDFRIGVLLDVVHALGYKIDIVPINATPFDFTKVKPAQPDEPVGPFKKAKTKKNEKSTRSSSSKK